MLHSYGFANVILVTLLYSNHCRKYNQNVRSLEWHYCHGTLHSFHPIQMTQKEEVEVGNFLDVASG